jgi:hypothetical protein
LLRSGCLRLHEAWSALCVRGTYRGTDGNNIIGPRLLTAADGRFAFSLVPDQRYDVHVMRSIETGDRTRGTQTSIVPFKASASSPHITVVLKPR